MVRERQTSWAGGEFAPTLWGRTDYARYATGAQKMLNLCVGRHGQAFNRAGSLFIDRIFDDGQALLVPFVFSNDDALLLVFTNKRIRFYQWDSALFQGQDWAIRENGAYIEIATPYEAENLRTLRFAQVGDVITIVSEHYAPHELSRLTSDSVSWLLEELSFDVPEPASFLVELRTPPMFESLWEEDIINVDPDNHFAPDYPLFSFGGTRYFRGSDWVGGILSLVVLEAPPSAVPPIEWSWQVTYVMQDLATGRTYETMPRDVERGFYTHPLTGDVVIREVPDAVVVNPGWTQRLRLGTQWGDGTIDLSDPNNPEPTSDMVIAIRIYRGHDGRFGFIGETKDSVYIDSGAEPDFSNPPPQGRNPFTVYAGETLLRTENPSVVTYFQDRRVFASTPERPNKIWESAVGEYRNFDEVRPPDDADSIEYEIASNKHETIRAILPRRGLLALTSSAEWTITGSNGPLISASSPPAGDPATEYGCAANPPPLVVGSTVFFVDSAGLPRALIFSEEGGGYQAVDIATLSSHFFEGHTIRAWAFAKSPQPILWTVRDDGLLLSFSFSREQEMAAWSQHEIAGDALVEDVVTLPEGTETGVYFVVNRDGVRTVERLAPRVLTDVRQGVFLDSAAKHDGFDIESGRFAFCPADTAVGGPFEGAIGGYVRITFDAAQDTALTGNVLQVDDPDGGLPWRFLLETLVSGVNVYDAQILSRTVPDEWFNAAGDFTLAFPQVIADDEWAYCIQSVRRLDHLEGQEVYAFRDGAVVGPLTVEAGNVDLGDFAAIVCVGLRITADFQGLDFGEEKGKQKITNRAWVEIEGGRGGYVGARLDGTLEELPARDVDHGYGAIPLLRDIFEVPVTDEWGQKGSVALRHTDPTPLTILGILRDVSIGGA